ncbi:MAG: ABC transporter ATP-binding protein [Dissulfurispiraceae bacterium]|nr:ABC transporter ATP-binding protein [Dissulfurispiraceae bacterium]
MRLFAIENISFRYRKKEIISNLSLSFKRGRVASLLGPNGSGKTTLLKLLLGIHSPRQGNISFEGRVLQEIPHKEFSRRVAYVPQIHRESFAYTVEDVVLMGRMPHKPFFSHFSKDDRDMAMHALKRLNIIHLKDKPYTEVSGGERQLTLIARALTQGADTFIMDEPGNGLDFGNQFRLLDQISGLAQDGYTFIFSTHFPDHALLAADRVVMLKEGDVIADGSPKETITPETMLTLYGINAGVVEVCGRHMVCVSD